MEQTVKGQNEANTRPVIDGTGTDLNRQAALNSELDKGPVLTPEVIEAKKLLADKKISVEEFRRRTNTH